MPIEDDNGLREVLDETVVAVVGCSSTPGKDAHEIPAYLREHGYEVLPVNPNAREVFDRPAYDSIADVEKQVGIVNVFRPSEEVKEIVDAVLERADEPVIWTQLGIHDEDALVRAEEAGLHTVEDRCMKVEHSRLV